MGLPSVMRGCHQPLKWKVNEDTPALQGVWDVLARSLPATPLLQVGLEGD